MNGRGGPEGESGVVGGGGSILSTHNGWDGGRGRWMGVGVQRGRGGVESILSTHNAHSPHPCHHPTPVVPCLRYNHPRGMGVGVGVRGWEPWSGLGDREKGSGGGGGCKERRGYCYRSLMRRDASLSPPHYRLWALAVSVATTTSINHVSC